MIPPVDFSYWDRVLEPVRRAQRQIQSLLNSESMKFIRQLEEIPKQQKFEMETLGKVGWFVDPEWPCTAAGRLAEAIVEGKVSDVDESLVRYFDEQAASIRDRLAKQFESRAKIITAAVGAHIAGQFELSTPVLLIQAEGAWIDVTGYQLFAQGLAAKYIRKLGLHDVQASLFHAATYPLPITAPTRQIAADANVLNRHDVLHGTSLSYATKINSSKALSLLCYISWLVAVLKREAAHVEENATE